ENYKENVAVTEYQKDSGITRSICYRDLDTLSDRLAYIFQEKGIRPKDVVSFQLPNSIEFAAVHLACLKIGAISNPLMPIFRERELDYMLDHIGTKLVLYKDGFRVFSYSQMYESLQRKNSESQAYDIFKLIEEFSGQHFPTLEAYSATE